MKKLPPEEELLRQVLQLARTHGWATAHFKGVRVMGHGGRYYHATPVQGDGAGWPDLVLVRGQRVIYAELKSDTGRLRPEQVAWRDRLLAAGQEWHCWAPRDWQLIVEVLS